MRSERELPVVTRRRRSVALGECLFCLFTPLCFYHGVLVLLPVVHVAHKKSIDPASFLFTIALSRLSRRSVRRASWSVQGRDSALLTPETPKEVNQTKQQEQELYFPVNDTGLSKSNAASAVSTPIDMARLVRRVAITVVSAVFSLFLLLHFSKRNILQTSIFPVQSPPPPRVPLFDISNLPPFKWRDLPQQNPVDPKDMHQLPTGPEGEIPQIQHAFTPSSESVTHRKERQRRLSAVKEAFKHSWNGYRKNAWLHDEVKPMSGRAADPFGGWAATLVDTLDTLWIMGLQTEFEEAVGALEEIDFSTATVREINVFESTIRYLGGFLSAYDLSEGKYPMLLQKAEEVAELIFRAFDTPNRMPITRWNWAE